MKPCSTTGLRRTSRARFRLARELIHSRGFDAVRWAVRGCRGSKDDAGSREGRVYAADVPTGKLRERGKRTRGVDGSAGPLRWRNAYRYRLYQHQTFVLDS